MMQKVLSWGLMAIITMIVAGCAASGMKDVTKTGFLGDYSQLKPGRDDQAALVYIKPGTQIKPNTKLMFDRITVVLSDQAAYKAVDPAVLKELTDYYQSAIFKALKGGYEIVDKPGPDVLRVRVAITELKPAKPLANTMSTIIPVGIVVSGATKATTGDNLGTGEAGTEVELIDSVTGERIAAAVDRRQGGKGVFRGEWEDTKDAFDYWAQTFRKRLDEMQKN
ncbi:MAG: DUF3313 domain-containing protein [Chlorobium sp.]|nr:DUF3313 domain-containing protein [Chlorobium sp.]